MQLLVVHLQKKKMQKEEKDTLLFQNYSGTRQITTIQVYIQCLYFDKVSQLDNFEENQHPRIFFFFFEAYQKESLESNNPVNAKRTWA